MKPTPPKRKTKSTKGRNKVRRLFEIDVISQHSMNMDADNPWHETAYLKLDEMSLKDAKRLHAWLTKAIAYLEQAQK